MIQSIKRYIKVKIRNFALKSNIPFYTENENIIWSSNVAVDALKGNNIQVQDGSRIKSDCHIGSYVYVGFNCFFTKCTIGNYTSIGNCVSIGVGEHELTDISTSAVFYENKDSYEKLTKKECIIGSDVWIGVGVVIRRGVKVGHGAVIGANSTVTKDVPNFAIVAGSPAKLIRYRFSAEQIKLIEQSRWWDYSKSDASRLQIEIKEKFKLLAK